MCYWLLLLPDTSPNQKKEVQDEFATLTLVGLFQTLIFIFQHEDSLKGKSEKECS